MDGDAREDGDKKDRDAPTKTEYPEAGKELRECAEAKLAREQATIEEENGDFDRGEDDAVKDLIGEDDLECVLCYLTSVILNGSYE